MSRQCEYYGCKSEATTTTTTSIATEMYPEATMTSHLCAAHAAESASVTVTVTVPEWIVRQIVAGEFTAVNAAAQIVETAVLSARGIAAGIDDIDLGTVVEYDGVVGWLVDNRPGWVSIVPVGEMTTLEIPSGRSIRPLSIDEGEALGLIWTGHEFIRP